MPISFCEQNNFNPNPVFSFLQLLLECRSSGFLPTHLHPLKKRQTLTVSSLAFQTPLCPLLVLITFLLNLSCASMITVIVLWKPSWKEQGMIHSLCDSLSCSFISIVMSTVYRVMSWRSTECCQDMVILDWCLAVDSNVCVNNSAVTNVCSSLSNPLSCCCCCCIYGLHLIKSIVNSSLFYSTIGFLCPLVLRFSTWHM